MIYRVYKTTAPNVQIGEVTASALKSIGDKISFTIDEKDEMFTITKISRPLIVERQIVTDVWVKESIP
jgi:hypothetical protein